MSNKKVLFIIAPKNFRDEEFFDTKEVLDKAGLEITIANSTGKPSVSKFGKVVDVNKKIDDIDSSNYDAIIFVGGSGSRIYFDDKKILNLSRDFWQRGKIVAAICIAPTILANSGILNGRRATAYTSEEERIKSVGTYTCNNVEKDGNIITAKWPTAAKDFGLTIVDSLK